MGNRLKELRIIRDLTQEQVADRLGVTHPTWQRWETNRNVDWMRKVESVAAALQCRPGELFEKIPQSDSLSPEERKLIELFRSLNRHHKQALVATAESLRAQSQPREVRERRQKAG